MTGRAGSDDEAGSKQQKASNPCIFRCLESYIAGCFSGCETLNTSFTTIRPANGTGERITASKPTETPLSTRTRESNSDTETSLSEIDAKTLLLGDFAENGFWWAGSRLDRDRSGSTPRRPKSPESSKGVVSAKTPRINWAEVTEWYRLVTQAGRMWKDKWKELCPDGTDSLSASRRARWQAVATGDIEHDITESRIHAQRCLLKSTENLLKRPRRPLKHAEDCRFLLILLANPLLSPQAPWPEGQGRSPKVPPARPIKSTSPKGHYPPQIKSSSSLGHHSGIVKRLLGLISNLPNEMRQFMVSCLSRTSDTFLQRLVDLVGGFVTYRLCRQHNRKQSEPINPTDGLVPSFSEVGLRHPSQLHAALEVRPASLVSRSTDGKPQLASYGEDWQVRAAARVMALLFAANTNHSSKRHESVSFDQQMQSGGRNTKHHVHAHGQALPISNFYNTMLDYADLVSDFETWESNRGKFTFCQYPFFLSIWAKIYILEHEARRQMENMAREAFFDSILSHKAVSQFLVLKVRRECLVEDSLQRPEN